MLVRKGLKKVWNVLTDWSYASLGGLNILVLLILVLAVVGFLWYGLYLKHTKIVPANVQIERIVIETELSYDCSKMSDQVQLGIVAACTSKYVNGTRNCLEAAKEAICEPVVIAPLGYRLVPVE